MRVTPSHLLVPILPIGVGALLIYLSLAQHWGSVWTAGGVFFIILGLAALVIAVAWLASGPLANVLRSPAVSIALVVLVVAAMCATVVLGMLQNGR